MRTNLDFTARSALVSSGCNYAQLLPLPCLHPHSSFAHNSSSYCMPFFQLGSGDGFALLCALPLELSVSHGKDYLESAAACKRLSDKRPHTAAADGDASPTHRKAVAGTSETADDDEKCSDQRSCESRHANQTVRDAVIVEKKGIGKRGAGC